MTKIFTFQKVWTKTSKIIVSFALLVLLVFGWQVNYSEAATLNNDGFTNQIEGRAQQDIGKVQSTFDKAGHEIEKAANRSADKVDAMSKQIQGRAQQDIGRTQDALQDAGSQVQDTSENALDAVKNFLLP